ncbi:hypothetical protein BD309DRAFT_1012649 [Dichomitus squalens]|uniref:Uncharacterized protein n=1 Tax=Dichomitus squalens TaxID=114155 RepID=A0A4Q9P914_9APHY|nr:hypothetical protein BD309DRAFT_1012649 [Dichomitus squalens]TBU51100.1 hypothetical protein BD310DRAFT_910879 [Dichomitus squalens]
MSDTSPPFVLQQTVEGGLKFLMLGTVLSSFLIPIAIMLFYFSTARLRRQPLFILNFLAILLGIAQGVLNFYSATSGMLHNANISTLDSALCVALDVFVPLCAETVLILRVLAVYPPRLLPRFQCFILYGSIVLLKVGRVVNVTYVIYRMVRGPSEQAALVLAEFVWHLPNAKLEYILQLVDDTLVSGLFLYKIHTKTHEVASDRHHESGIRRARDMYLFRRLKTLFWISVCNFVFPVVLNVVQLVLILGNGEFERGILVQLVNNYITIIGVLLATIWASSSQWQEEEAA